MADPKDNHIASWIWLGVAVVIGLTVWFVTAYFAGNADPTGSKLYWLMGYPVLVVASGAIAFVARKNTWIAGATMLAAQLTAVLIASKGDDTQLLFGLVLYVIYGLPLVGASALGCKLSRRTTAKRWSQ